MNKIFLQILSLLLFFSLDSQQDRNLFKKVNELKRNKILKNSIPTRFSFSDLILKIFNIDKNDPYHTIAAKVRLSSDLCQEEQDFLKQRKQFVKEKLKAFIDQDLPDQKVPTIAICCSGGGYRAMVYTLGAFLGAEDLLDVTTYVAGLSGSSWFLSSLYVHKFTLYRLKELIRGQISYPLQEDFEIQDLVSNGIYKYLYDQKLSLVGIWGALIANRIFSDFEADGKNIMATRSIRSEAPKLTYSKERIANGNMPMPIHTAAEVTNPEFEWFEFTPYEIGCAKLKSFVPSWSFGRKFNNGISTNFAPEYGLDYLVGVWGSAFTASLSEILKDYKAQIPSILFNPINECVGNPEFGLGDLRLSPAQVFNFTKGLSNLNDNKLVNERFTLIDAGVSINLPVPPLLRQERNIDLIIILDSSSVVKDAPELKEAEDYARSNNLKFPKINYENIDKSIISVFKDEEDLSVPVIIYMPIIKNESYSKTFDPIESINSNGYCSTFNLKYTFDQFNELSGLAEYNIKQVKNTIVDTIKYVISRR